MKITKRIREYLTKNHNLPAGASDETANALFADVIASGKATASTISILQAADAADAQKSVKDELRQIVRDEIGGVGGTVTKSTTQKPGALSHIMATELDNNTTDTIRVKDASERYLDVKSVGKHKLTGRPVELEGNPVYTPSQKELAQIGAWFKDHCRRNANAIGQSGVTSPAISEHEEQLLAEMRAKGRWSGTLAGEREVNNLTLGEMFGKQGADDMTLKALLNDATSGGQYLVPSHFDESAVVTYPLLHSELLPRVDLRTTNRDTVETAAFSNPTVAWGGSDTSVSLFTTTSMITQISAGVYDVVAALEMGRDFLADSPVEVGAKLTEIYGQLFAKELDDVICKGVDSSNQPEGIFSASGTVTVNSDNGSTGPWTLADLEAAMFSVGKQYRIPALNPCFLSNDTTYARLRGIAVGTTDQRRVFGMDHQSYTTFGFPHLINGDASNPQLAFVCLKRYALWRRAGVSIEFVTGGKTLALSNSCLLVARARYGGQLLDPNAASVITDGQS
jgi:HK97 family phage major capsid protein